VQFAGETDSLNDTINDSVSITITEDDGRVDGHHMDWEDGFSDDEYDDEYEEASVTTFGSAPRMAPGVQDYGKPGPNSSYYCDRLGIPPSSKRPRPFVSSCLQLFT
jgi:hypothetical protein